MEFGRRAVVLALLATGVVAAAATGAVLLFRRGVHVGPYACQARGIGLGSAGLLVDELVVDGPRARMELERCVVSGSFGALKIRSERGAVTRRAVANDGTRTSNSAFGGPAIEFAVGRLRLVEDSDGNGSPPAELGYLEDVGIRRAASGEVAFDVRRGRAARWGVAGEVEGAAVVRNAEREWTGEVQRVQLSDAEGSQMERPAHAERAAAARAVDGGAELGEVLEGYVARADGLLRRAIAAVPMGALDVRTVEVESPSFVPGAHVRLSAVHVAHDVEGIRLRLEAAGATSAAPLFVDARLDGSAARLHADVHGGPLVLGDEGRWGTGRAIEFAADGTFDYDARRRTVDANGAVRVSGVALRKLWLGAEPVELDGALGGRLTVDASGDFRLDEGAFDLGHARALRGHVTARGNWRELHATVDAGLVRVACQDAVDALPAPFRGTVGRLRFEGEKAFSVHAEVRIASPERTRLEVRGSGSCTAVAAPKSLTPEAYDERFELTIPGAKGEPRTEVFGPGTDRWRPLARVSRAFLAGVLTTEDAGFFRHDGIAWYAIRSALTDDLKARRFVRGGSTLTMQLAKNLFLGRQKNIARKLEEMLLTDYLEDAFGKERILELYANIVELGPDVFGIEDAARHHFGVGADELGILEGFWLATLLPNPRERAHIRADGTVSGGKMKELRALVRKARGHGLLTDEDVADAEATELVVPRREGLPVRPAALGLSPPSDRRDLRAIEGP